MTVFRKRFSDCQCQPLGSRGWFGHSSYWICQGIGWIGMMVLSLMRMKNLDPVQLGGLFHSLLVCMLLSHLYRWSILGGNWKNKNLTQLIFLVIVFSMVLGTLATAYIYYFLPEYWAAQIAALNQSVPMIVLSMSFVYIAWSALYFGYHFHIQLRDIQLRELRLQMSMKEASLAMLQTQINPHFLFNGLNTLRALIDHNPDRAREVVTQMSLIFRASLSRGEKLLIPLREELELVDAYLLIEKARFEERLEIERKIGTRAEEALVPPFLLQTLIENAVKYGISPFCGPGRVYFEARLDGAQLILLVRNPGQILRQVNSTRLGLKISRERLHLQFGETATLEVANLPENQVQARAVIPQIL